jgi:pimeloyl-ACP methyl ester carboxylesterase
LGGVEQWVLIRGHNRKRPMLLFLHGGPGSPIFPRSREFGEIAGLDHLFTTVYWEQRGSGKSCHRNIAPQSMNPHQFVSDLTELSKMLISKYGNDKIYLMGRSWGSLIGLLAVHQHPSLYKAFIGIGQIVAPLEGEKLSYEFSHAYAKKQNWIDAKNELEKIGYPPYTPGEFLIQRKWLTKMDKKVMRDLGYSTPTKWDLMKKLLGTPEYSLIDIINMGMDPYFSINQLWNEEYYSINLFDQISYLEIPVFFICGKYDYFSPTKIVKEYFNRLNAPAGKEIFIFEKSGHEPELQEPQLFKNILLDRVLSQ